LKLSYVPVLLAALIPATAAFIAAPAMQAAQSAATAPAAAPADEAPKNLKVLSKDLTIHQVRDIMNDWTDALGVECSTCHVRDPNNLAPNGRPRFNYADDSKQEKRTARVMYAMTQEINSQFLSKVPNSGIPISCSTCHRGHLSPVPFNGDDDSAPAPAAH
jgi:cytochrome c5